MPYFYFDETTVDELQDYLVEKGVLSTEECITTLEKAGDGNMNATLRVSTTSDCSYVVKQSRPFVKKYPEYKAPEERCISEITFYNTVKELKGVDANMPALVHFFEDDRLAIYEYLDHVHDGEFIYNLTLDENYDVITPFLQAIATWLGNLHILKVKPNSWLRNREMAEFQRHQMFDVPYELLQKKIDSSTYTPIEKKLWNVCRSSAFLVSREGLNKKLMEEGDTLLHGDFFPKNWLLKKEHDIRIIDPEFCFFGPKEYDLGVLLAHMQIAGLPIPVMASVLKSYASIVGTYDAHLCDGYARFEVLRRLIGVAKVDIPSQRAEKLLQETLDFYLQ